MKNYFEKVDMRKFASILLLIILSSLITLSFALILGARREADLSIPYVHYYSYIDNGLIIERADGTDSRIIRNIAPETANSIVWRNWSVSGKWFAMSSFHSNGEGGDFTQQSYVVSSDGQHKIDLGRNSLSELHTLWSPNEDILLVVRADRLNGGISFQLLDIATEQYLASFHLEAPYLEDFYFYSLELSWAENGETAYVSSDRRIVSLHKNGFTEMYYVDDGQQWQIEPTFYQRRLLYPRSIMVNESVLLRIEDLDTEQYLDIEDNVWGRWPYPYRINWSPSLNHALISARPCGEEACEGWLKLVDWSSGEVYPLDVSLTVMPNNDRDCYYVPNCEKLWSPTGRFAIFMDENENFYLLDVNTASIQEILPNQTIEYFYWLSDEELLLQLSESKNLTRYNLTTNELEATNLPVTGIDISPSPNHEYLAVPSSPPMVVNLAGEIVAQTISHSHSTHSYANPWSYTWSEDSSWLMAHYTISFAGGGGGPTASVLFDLEGQVRRELPTSGVAGFVPNRVIPYLSAGQSSSLKREPIFTLPHLGRLILMGWHPEDANQLVTYSQEDGLSFWSLEGEQAQLQYQIMPEEELPVDFPLGAALYWSPEQNIVSTNGVFSPLIDTQTGKIVDAEIDYPSLHVENNELSIQYAISENVLPLEGDMLSLPFFLSSNRESFIAPGVEYEDGLYHINAHSGVITHFEGSNYFFTADANGRYLAVGNIYDCCVRLFDIEDASMIEQFYGTAYSLAFSGDGRRLATTSSGMVTIWDVSDYQQGR